MDNFSPSLWIDDNLINLLRELNQNLLSNEQRLGEDTEESSGNESSKGLQKFANSTSSQQTQPTDMTDQTLTDLPICELNQMLRDCEAHEAQELKRRRRCLKNREYAVSARLKRVKVQEGLERENDKLKEELSKAREEQARIIAERDSYRQKSEVLEAAWTSLSECVDQANSESSSVYLPIGYKKQVA